MKLIDLCKQPAVSVDCAATLRDAAQLMRRHHVGALVVTRHGAAGLEPIGIVTDRDLAVEAIARELDVRSISVGSLVGDGIVGVPADAGLDEAVLRMRASGVRRLIVHAADGELAGIVSFDDLIDAYATALGQLGDVLRRGFAREARRRPDVADPPPVRIPSIGTIGWQLRDRLANGA